MLGSNINFRFKIKLKKLKKLKRSNIIKLSDIDYVQTLSFNKKYYTYFKITFWKLSFEFKQQWRISEAFSIIFVFEKTNWS
jgi:hypothetical protein